MIRLEPPLELLQPPLELVQSFCCEICTGTLHSGCLSSPSSPCTSLSAWSSEWFGPVSRLFLGNDVRVVRKSERMCATVSIGFKAGRVQLCGKNSIVFVIQILLVFGM